MSDLQQDIQVRTNLKMLRQKINSKTATYTDAGDFSKIFGDAVSKSINRHTSEGVEETFLKQFAEELLAPIYRECQKTMIAAGTAIQSGINENAGIGLKPAEVITDESRISHLIQRFAEAASYEDVAFLTNKNTARSITRGAVNDCIKANAKFQSNAGLKVLISRSDGSGCCDWCASVTGTYKSIDALPDGFWGIHRGCGCTIDYNVGKTHSRLSYSTDDKRNIVKNTENYEKEESNKVLKSLEKETLVDMNYINSKEYRNKLDAIIQDTNERRAVENASKDILEHRTGTHFEDLAYINTNSKQLKTIINKDYDYYDIINHISECKANASMKSMIKNSKEYTVIGVHNHPSSSVPSMNDIKAARDRKYKYGIIPCHDGTIYKYKVNSSFKDEFNANIYLAELGEAFYNNDIVKLEKNKKSLSDLGIYIEVI